MPGNTLPCIVLTILVAVWADDACIQQPSLSGPSVLDLPLCGNGVLDPGEVCDDGNRVGGDGCNAWCSAFDRITKVCTLAGQNSFYASSGPQKRCISNTLSLTLHNSLPVSQAFFCSLSAIAASPSGSYIVVAEGGLLLRIDLYTDMGMSSVSVFPATITNYLFSKFCSLFVLADDTVIANECAQQKMVLFYNAGKQYRQILSLPFMPTPVRSRAYQDGDLILMAGVPLSMDSTMCVELYAFNITSTEGYTFASLPCVAYNVIEGGNIYPSFSLDGMVPYQVTMEGCKVPSSSVFCYVVYMDRSDMQIVKAYISVEGGMDVQYYASTNDDANVLGSPLVLTSQASKMTYSLTGNCFTALNGGTPLVKLTPPMIALGNTCGLLPFTTSSAACSMPLNNPFITEFASSPYLLPQGLSSRLQHQTLLKIFSYNASSPSTGLPLYRQILDNTHNGTVPIDFVEMPDTRDIIYITQTSVGLISTKGIVFMDLFNPGFCRATQAILCPFAMFGSVGGVCTPCTQADSSVSAQIQCVGSTGGGSQRRLLSTSSFQSPPYTKMGLIVTKSVTKDLLDALVNYYLMAKGFPCTHSGGSSMTAFEPYNMLADAAEAQMSINLAQQQTFQLITQAGIRDGRNYLVDVSDEYMVRWSINNSTLVDALHTPSSSYVAVAAGLNNTALKNCGFTQDSLQIFTQLDNSSCRFLVNRDFQRAWLPCVLQEVSSLFTTTSSNASKRRRSLLMAQDSPSAYLSMASQQPMAVEHSQSTFFSQTLVSYSNANAVTDTTGLGGAPSQPSISNSDNNGNTLLSSSSFWIIVGGIVGGLLMAIAGVIVVYYFCLSPSKKSRYATIASDDAEEVDNDGGEGFSVMRKRV